ncbi:MULTISPECIES: hypothetical protein [Streptomyces]|uniref:hypothetical protein n=1 Tax=Streptomyces TaxID=1883 RepID=UPI00130073EE|nr:MULTISPECIES: hypothetical protein [Streptomyces]
MAAVEGLAASEHLAVDRLDGAGAQAVTLAASHGAAVVDRGLLTWLCGVPGWKVWRAGGDGTARQYCQGVW